MDLCNLDCILSWLSVLAPTNLPCAACVRNTTSSCLSSRLIQSRSSFPRPQTTSTSHTAQSNMTLVFKTVVSWSWAQACTELDKCAEIVHTLLARHGIPLAPQNTVMDRVAEMIVGGCTQGGVQRCGFGSASAWGRRAWWWVLGTLGETDEGGSGSGASTGTLKPFTICAYTCTLGTLSLVTGFDKNLLPQLYLA